MVREVKRKISRLLISTKGKVWLQNLTDIEISHNTCLIPKLAKMPYEIDEWDVAKILRIKYPNVFKRSHKHKKNLNSSRNEILFRVFCWTKYYAFQKIAFTCFSIDITV